MAPAHIHHPDLARIIDRFPAEAAQIRRVYLADQTFRSACEDYHLARSGLARFEIISIDTPRHEVEDYRRVVRELEAEILALIAVPGAEAQPLGPGKSRK